MGGKRKPTERSKYWRHGNFQTDNYESDIRSKYAENWEEYQNLANDEARTNFGSTDVPFVNILYAHGISDMRKVLHLILNKPIIKIAITEKLFHPDNVNDVMQQRARIILKMLSEDHDDEFDASGRDKYI